MNTLNKMKLKLVLVGLFAFSAQSAPLELTDEPLFLNQSVPPALAVTFDDSGSMSWSWMPDSRSFSRSLPSFASSDYNLIYYNPNIEYPPPVKADGTLMPQSNFSNAKRDGYAPSGMISNIDLRSRYRVFRYYYPYYTSNSYSISYASAGRSNKYNRAFYYEWVGPADASISERRNQSYNYKRHDISTSAEKQNFANWYTYYNTRSKLARAAVSHAFVNFGPDFKIDWQQINRNKFNSGSAQMKTFSGTHRQNFYDWLFQIPGSGSTPLRQATKYAGELFSDHYSGTSVYYDANYGGQLSCQQNFHIAISDGSWNSSSGIYGNIDGGANVPDAAVSYSPSSYFYADVNSSTLADTAFYYWLKDLKTSLANQVPTFIDDYTAADGSTIVVDSSTSWTDDPELFWNPNNDPANWQHMVNFNVGLGIEGSFDRNTDLPALRSKALTWPKTYSDTCFMRDSSGKEVFRSCANHFCFDGLDTQTANIVDCAGEVAPLGDIQLCFNADSNSVFNCDNRIVRKVNQSQGRVDDVWHASLNSRGDYFSAQNPEELATALYNVVSSIIKRKGRASAGSVSSNIISNETLAFKTGYDTADWSGFVAAATLNEDGTIGEVQWDAGCKLTGGECTTMAGSPIVNATKNHATRNIFTFDKQNNTQHPFHTVNMSTYEEYLIMNSTYIQQSSTNGKDFTLDDIIHYIRGDRNYEKQFGGPFRNRNRLLGDVINSSAKIIRGPASSYNDDIWSEGSPERQAADNGNGYNQFKQANRDRDNIILVGANDGMLHAFDAGINTTNGGDELWAFIPSKVINGLSEYANPAYKHKSYVDSTPFVKDAFINGDWRTVAIGGLRHGGKSFYALDLGNDPKNEPTVLWEFTDDDDPDMGYSYGGGIISRVAVPDATGTGLQTKWVAFLPNGYNSSSHKSVLYAVDLETGQVLHKWNTGLGSSSVPNGMGPPVAADFIAYDTADTSTTYYGADQGVDFVYAGDLHGNIYRFNVSDIFTGNNTIEPIYYGNSDQPITVAPRLFTPSDGTENIILTFGTGKYIELKDRGVSGYPKQYLIGLKDSKDPISNPFSLYDSRLVEQTLTTNNDARTVSSNIVAVDEGWKIELPVGGERIVNSLGRNNQSKLLIAASIIPNGDNPCLPGGNSWLMILDARTGSTPVNGKILNNSQADGVLINDILTGINFLTTPGGNQQIITIDGATGGGNGVTSGTLAIDTGMGQRWKRRSWHRIIFD